MSVSVCVRAVGVPTDLSESPTHFTVVVYALIFSCIVIMIINVLHHVSLLFCFFSEPARGQHRAQKHTLQEVRTWQQFHFIRSIIFFATQISKVLSNKNQAWTGEHAYHVVGLLCISQTSGPTGSETDSIKVPHWLRRQHPARSQGLSGITGSSGWHSANLWDLRKLCESCDTMCDWNSCSSGRCMPLQIRHLRGPLTFPLDSWPIYFCGSVQSFSASVSKPHLRHIFHSRHLGV